MWYNYHHCFRLLNVVFQIQNPGHIQPKQRKTLNFDSTVKLKNVFQSLRTKKMPKIIRNLSSVSRETCLQLPQSFPNCVVVLHPIPFSKIWAARMRGVCRQVNSWTSCVHDILQHSFKNKNKTCAVRHLVGHLSKCSFDLTWSKSSETSSTCSTCNASCIAENLDHVIQKCEGATVWISMTYVKNPKEYQRILQNSVPQKA